MLYRSVQSALKLQWRFARAAVGDLGAPAYSSHHHPLKSGLPADAGLAASKAFSSSCSAQIQFGWGSRTSGAASDQAVTAPAAAAHPSASVHPSGLHALQQVLGIQHEHALVSRCAAVWQIPAEILQANVQALADVLHPCGRDTTAHALWVMVRCPELRHADEQQLRSTLRHLSAMVQHLDLDKPTLLAAVYRKPWMVRAAAARAHRARAAAAAKAQGGRSKQSSSAACSRQGGGGSSSDADFSDGEEGSSSSGGRYMAPWHHEALLLMLELSTSNTRPTPSGSRGVSPAPAIAAVRGYLAAAEAMLRLSSGWKAVASVLLGSARMQAAAAAAASVTSARQDDASSNSSSSSYDALQQLLAACPLLALLPRDVLLSRWRLLLSGLLGSHQAAAALLKSSPYIVVSYADLQDSSCPYELQGSF
ncbi:hypothetical protein COO60DRAFT_1139818 [Scenedesmus sp. NREL 46B-D3]|nr:hypothetical protein COO60DRAFT_1139818 [Scenedesmus sp. NREL 46B-D3]